MSYHKPIEICSILKSKVVKCLVTIIKYYLINSLMMKLMLIQIMRKEYQT